MARFGPGGFLEYNTQYNVLVCRECQYAIQTSAIESHLLRHKIYREERRRLVEHISQYGLLEPEEVRYSLVPVPPVPGVRITAGFKCVIPSCFSLFASRKRMQRHGAEVHDSIAAIETFTQPAALQTLFRGTKLRYFEVGIDHSLDGSSVLNAVDDSLATSQPIPARLRSEHLDLRTMKYLHHFTACTSLTLPGEFLVNHEEKCWQLKNVEIALEVEWLACGILAIAAAHLHMAKAPDLKDGQFHQNELTRLNKKFSHGWASEKQRLGKNEAVSSQIRIGAQINCILRCATWLSSALSMWQATEKSLGRNTSELRFVAETLIGWQESTGTVHDEAIAAWNTKAVEASKALDPLPPIVSNLRSLPFRMADVFGRPDDASDVLTILSAINSLIDCCQLSYYELGKHGAWVSMNLWLRRVPHRLLDMLSEGNPAAIILVAYWGKLVSRAEKHYWFLSGLGDYISLKTASQLPERPDMRSLLPN